METIAPEAISQEVFEKPETITEDQLMVADTLQDNESIGATEPEDDQDYHEKFMKQFREQSRQELLQESKGINFEEDDDRFLMSLNKDPEKP